VGVNNAPALTRKDIWEGLHARRSYAVTGVRILLDFTVDGVPMGGTVRPADGTVALAGTLHGVGPLDRVEVVKYDGAAWTEVYAHAADGALDWSFSVDDPAAKPGTIYYLRARQQDGNRAWSSPVWVEAAPAPAP
jgi:hypothetical protein